MNTTTHEQEFLELLRHSHTELVRDEVMSTLQINVGKRCNMACLHCHVEAGPNRTEEMSEAVARRVMALLEASPSVGLVDFTGGAPELNANFRWMVKTAAARNVRIIDRCNLSVLFEPGQETTAEFLAEHGVEVVASLPCYSLSNVEKQRGKGAFDKSVRGLQLLNSLGYGQPGSGLLLNLVYNPLGPSLPPPQASLEEDYKRVLNESFNVQFNQLLTLANMPIKRFESTLRRDGKLEDYYGLLRKSFNPGTVAGLMCRSLVSVGWDGQLYDCDFNQMLAMPLGAGARTLWDLHSFEELGGSEIATGRHCLGCTAGSGSSCGGALS